MCQGKIIEEGLKEEVPDIYLQLIVNNVSEENGILAKGISDMTDVG